MTLSEELLNFPVSRGLEYAQSAYIKDTIDQLVEATPYLGNGLPANARLEEISIKPSLGQLKPHKDPTSSMFHEYWVTYHEEVNPDPDSPKGWGSKFSPPTSSYYVL